MRALLIYCHPNPESFTAAVRDAVVAGLERGEAEVRVIDLYASGFDACLSAQELIDYENEAVNCAPVHDHVDALRWCDTLIFVYPTWWYGLPARLKGWLDRVLVPGVAFLMPDADHADIRPGLTNVTTIAAYTTCGASRWLTALVGAPGKRTLLRGVRAICARRCRTSFAAHYLMDSSTPESRDSHLKTVAVRVDKLVGRPSRRQAAA